jgi:hypothetical protein
VQQLLQLLQALLLVKEQLALLELLKHLQEKLAEQVVIIM